MAGVEICGGNLFLTWWSGEEIKQCTLLGWKIVFWARAGKWLQFAAGLVVLLDLLGPDRLRRLASRSQELGWVQFIKEYKSHSLSPEERKERASLSERAGRRLGATAILLSLAATIIEVATGVILPDGLLEMLESDSRLVVFYTAITLVSAFVLAVATVINYCLILIVALLTIGVLFAIGIVFVFLVSWIAEIQYRALRGDPPGYPLRWASLALFLFGFSFDMLGS